MELDKAMDEVSTEVGKKLIPVFEEVFADLSMFLERERERRRNEKIVMAGAFLLVFLLAMIYWWFNGG